MQQLLQSDIVFSLIVWFFCTNYKVKLCCQGILVIWLKRITLFLLYFYYIAYYSHVMFLIISTQCTSVFLEEWDSDFSWPVCEKFVMYLMFSPTLADGGLHVSVNMAQFKMTYTNNSVPLTNDHSNEFHSAAEPWCIFSVVSGDVSGHKAAFGIKRLLSGSCETNILKWINNLFTVINSYV